MLIDWFTVGAQIVNFLILVWLLKRFLYKPILAAMEAREQQIAANLQEAQKKKIEAETASANFHKQLADLERHKAADLQKAAEETEAARRKMLGEAREEIKTLRAKWQAALRDEQEELCHDLARKVQQEVFAMARQVLQDLAGESLEARMAELWMDRLRTLDQEEKERLVASLRHAQGQAVIRSAFDLPAPVREKLTQAVKQELGTDARVAFETAPNLIGGIELNTADRKLSWTIAASLSAWEKSVAELLDREDIADGRKEERPLVSAGPSV